MAASQEVEPSIVQYFPIIFSGSKHAKVVKLIQYYNLLFR